MFKVSITIPVIVNFIKIAFVTTIIFIGFYFALTGSLIINEGLTNMDMGGAGGFTPPSIMAGPAISIIGLSLIFIGTYISALKYKYFFYTFTVISFFILSYNLWTYPPYTSAYFMAKGEGQIFPSDTLEHFISFSLIGACLYFCAFHQYKNKLFSKSLTTTHLILALCISSLISCLLAWGLFFCYDAFINLQITSRAGSWQNITLCTLPIVVTAIAVIAFYKNYRYLAFTLFLPSSIVIWMCLLSYFTYV